jgi:cobalt/nickel transport protein
MKITTKLWIGIGALALLSPLGIIMPEKFKAGNAWGEWGVEEFSRLVGYIPEGLKKYSSLWSAPMPDYAAPGMEHAGLGHLSAVYVVAGILGVALCVGTAFLIGNILIKKRNHRD